MTNRHRILLIALCFLHVTVAAGEIRANLQKPVEQRTRDVYYVIVASGHYLHHTHLIPTDIDGAMNSALRMKEIFQTIGATDDNGIVLISTPQKPITRSDITKALHDMAKKVVADHARNPLGFFTS